MKEMDLGLLPLTHSKDELRSTEESRVPSKEKTASPILCMSDQKGELLCNASKLPDEYRRESARVVSRAVRQSKIVATILDNMTIVGEVELPLQYADT